MFPSLEAKLRRFEDLERALQDPAVQSDVARMIAIQREYGSLTKVARAVREYHTLADNAAAARSIIDEESDPEARRYAEAELAELLDRQQALESVLEDLATAGDAITRGSLIMEIRAGTGGDEAALFARDLFDMYHRFVEGRAWTWEVLDAQGTELGGFKEVVVSIAGDGAFRQLQFESGGHRVQRVPETETQGRIHTSLATVAVMPEAEDVEINVPEDELQIDTMRAGGPGGQKVNKTESAVRITHLPSGIVVKIQDEKSQHKNRAKAMRVLRSRLLELKQQEAAAARSEARRTLIGSGDRSQRIRTYNFPDNRVTDHRIGLSLYKLDQILTGNLDELVDSLLEFDRQERLGRGSQQN